MSTKYSTDNDSRMLADGEGQPVKLTDHALHRWRQRTPADSEIGIREAWRRGEAIKHPEVAVCEGNQRAELVRVFRHSDGWSAVFVVVRDHKEFGSSGLVVATTLVIGQYDHGPTRAYLESHGPHDLGEQR